MATQLTVHRLLLTALLLSAKVYEDTVYDNVYFAKVGGVALRELNAMEVAMLDLLQGQLIVRVEDLQRCIDALEAGRLVLH